MAVLECFRIVLFIIEWIWTTVILGIFPNQLIQAQKLTNGETAAACLLNLNLGRSRCDFGIAWAAIAFIVLSCTIIWYSLEYCTTSIVLPANVETVIFSWLSIWWGVGAIALTAVKSSKAPSAANVPVVFAWMLFVLSGVSAFIGSHGPKPIDYRVNTETEDPSTY